MPVRALGGWGSVKTKQESDPAQETGGVYREFAASTEAMHQFVPRKIEEFEVRDAREAMT